jgi:hypothetical protein
MGVLERGDDVDTGVWLERVCVGDLQHDVCLRLLTLWDLGDEQVWPVAAKLAAAGWPLAGVDDAAV